MANINVKKRLENISGEMKQIANHVSSYSGVSSKEAKAVIRELEQISFEADQIAKHAQAALVQ